MSNQIISRLSSSSRKNALQQDDDVMKEGLSYRIGSVHRLIVLLTVLLVVSVILNSRLVPIVNEPDEGALVGAEVFGSNGTKGVNDHEATPVHVVHSYRDKYDTTSSPDQLLTKLSTDDGAPLMDEPQQQQNAASTTYPPDPNLPPFDQVWEPSDYCRALEEHVRLAPAEYSLLAEHLKRINDDVEDGLSLYNGTPRTQKLILIFAKPRVGSTLVQDALKALPQTLQDYMEEAHQPMMNFASLFELFWLDREYDKFEPLIRLIWDFCSRPSPFRVSTATTATNSTSNQDEIVAAIKMRDSMFRKYASEWRRSAQAFADAKKTNRTTTTTQSSTEESSHLRKAWLHYFDQMGKNPKEILQFIRNIPTWLPDHSYVVFKVFWWHLTNSGVLNMPVDRFIDLVLEVWDPMDVVVLVQWRRRFIESFVSKEIALKSRKWVDAETTADDKVVIHHDQLERFVDCWFQYYIEVRESLIRTNLKYGIIEYNRDLRDRPKQIESMKRILETMNITMNQVSSALDHVLDVKRKKQSQVSVDQQVLNWDEATKWGLTEEAPDWDSFSTSRQAEGASHCKNYSKK